ncbi:Uncharacterised protein [uncultured Clostridium sp.]|uniref:hypothetical protein n=1 Tax=uncultured Clostridium sp. TaxID=59620 RepID=UPI000822A34A|nr:hypothetical protein [uncultured Clostridium sp.]SCI99940.1 Uncharacterised protein [uncultured Clostridium sp.]
MNLTDNQIENIVVESIIKHLNNPKFDYSYVVANFTYAMELGMEELKERLKQPSNVVSMTEGGRSITFKNNLGILSENVKALLPKPYIRMW